MNLAINQLIKLFSLSVFCTALLFSAPVLSLDTDRDTLPGDWELANGRDPAVADYQISHRHSQACVLDDDGVKCWGTGSQVERNGLYQPPQDLSDPKKVSVADGISTPADMDTKN